MTRLVEFCGPPGAGKSFWAARFVESLATRLRLDACFEPARPADLAGVRRLARKAGAVTAGIAFAPALGRQGLVHLFPGAQESSARRLMLTLNLLDRLGMLTRQFRAEKIMVFDQGFAQLAAAGGLRDGAHLQLFLRELRDRGAVHEVVFVEVRAKSETRRQRLADRAEPARRRRGPLGACTRLGLRESNEALVPHDRIARVLDGLDRADKLTKVIAFDNGTELDGWGELPPALERLACKLAAMELEAGAGSGSLSEQRDDQSRTP